MVDKEKVKLCAENIAKSIHMVNEGENVFIRGGLYSQDLLEEIGLCIYRNGGIPFISYTSDDYINSIYQDPSIKVKTIELTPQHHLNLIKSIDAYMS